MRKNKRLANIELLRILAMFMVTMLHYLDKGGILPDLAGELTINGYLAWILELLSIVAVDVYMLISGFFLVETEFKVSRLLRLLCQVLFYSILIPIVMALLGLLDPAEITIYDLLYFFLPTQMVHYWFITAYVTMYLFSPLLGIAVKSMKKEQLRIVIVLLLLFLSVGKSIFPVRLTMDNLGYDGVWFMCVYLVAAYLRLYGMEELANRKRWGIPVYFVAFTGMFLLTMAIRFLYLKTGKFEDFMTTVCGYNHILTLFAAICLFVGFYDWKMKDGKFSRLVLRAAPYTLGVYLLQEHCEVRYLWPSWLGASADGNPVLFVLRCVGSVTLVLVTGILVDMARGFLFGLAGKFLAGSRLDRFLGRLDAKMAGNRET